MRHIRAITAVFLVLFTAMSGVWADDDEKTTLDHPIKILKARYENNTARSSLGATRGKCTVWMQNVTDVLVDGVKLEVVLYNRHNRKVDTLTKDIGELEPGQKLIKTFDWDVVAEDSVKPRIWVYYNGGGDEPTRFEGEPPVW